MQGGCRKMKSSKDLTIRSSLLQNEFWARKEGGVGVEKYREIKDLPSQTVKHIPFPYDLAN